MIRLALTSTTRRNRALADLVRGLGLEPVELPCIEVVPDAGGSANLSAHLRDAEVLVLTSARTVDLVPEGARAVAPPVLAVGSATAFAANEAGLTVVAAGDGGVDRLVDDHARHLEGRDVVFAGSANLLERTVAILGRHARRVRGVPLYRTVPIPPAPDPVDAAVFGSPTAVAGWASVRSFDGVVVAAVGATTAASLLEIGVVPDVVPDAAGFTDAIEAVAASRPERSMR